MKDPLTDALAADLDRAFEALVLAHQDRLFTIAVRLLGDRRDAEEATQDAFVRAYRALAAYDPDRVRELRLRPWLATILVNLCRNRTARRPPPLASLDPATGDPGAYPVGARTTHQEDSPDGAVARREEARRWAQLLATLPIRYRVPVVLRHVDGLSFPEMSDALGRPEGTLKAQVHRGLALLRAAHDAAERRERAIGRPPEELTA